MRPILLILLLAIALVAQENQWDHITDTDKLAIIEAKQWVATAQKGGDEEIAAGWNLATASFYPAFKSPDIEVTGLITKGMLTYFERNYSNYETCRNLQRLKSKLETMHVLDIGGPISQDAYLALTKNPQVNRPSSVVLKEQKERLIRDMSAARENMFIETEIVRLGREVADAKQSLVEIEAYVRKGNSSGDSRTASWWASERERKRSEQESIQQQLTSKSDLLASYKGKAVTLPMVAAWYAGTGLFAKTATSSHHANAELLLANFESSIAWFEADEQKPDNKQ